MKALLTIVLIGLCHYCFSQPPVAIPPAKDHYLQKSKNQKSGAWVLLVGGTALVAGGVLGANNANTWNGVSAGGVTALLGGVCVLISVPLFLESGRNKRKAAQATAFIKMEKAPAVLTHQTSPASFTAIALKVKL